jgi:UDP-3-O-[3-hydroxymyristoyl] N-acetylglucosamine deacetylase
MTKTDELFFGNQHTVAQEFELFGKGLISGEICSIRVKPAPEDTGIVFIANGEEVKLSQNTTYPGFHNLTLRSTAGDILYIEHILSVFFAFGVDNAIVEIEGKEIPFFDGSSLIFSERMLQVGLKEQNSIRKYMVITEKVEVKDGESLIVAEPSDKFIIHAVYKSPKTGIKEELFVDDISIYPDEIAPARTFIYEKDLNEALKAGLFKGGDMDSAIIFSEEDKPINTDLRFENERVRHKILDFLGDIYCSGVRIFGKFFLFNQSHKLSRELLKKLKYILL